MSLFSKLFGGGGGSPKAPEPVDHDGFKIFVEPIKEGSGYRLAARIDASDRFMEAAFDRFQETEKQFTTYVDGNAKRSAMVTVTICALMTLGITMLAYTMSRTATPVVPPAPVEAGASAAAGEGVPAGEVPGE